MKKITQKELNEIIKKHQMWLNDENGGERARFNDMNLNGLDLSNSNLEAAYFCGTDLVHSNLENCNLKSCQMCYADLSYANLKNANIQYADLSSCILINTNLENCNLYQTTLDVRSLQCKAKLDGVKIYGYVLRKEENNERDS